MGGISIVGCKDACLQEPIRWKNHPRRFVTGRVGSLTAHISPTTSTPAKRDYCSNSGFFTYFPYLALERQRMSSIHQDMFCLFEIIGGIFLRSGISKHRSQCTSSSRPVSCNLLLTHSNLTIALPCDLKTAHPEMPCRLTNKIGVSCQRDNDSPARLHHCFPNSPLRPWAMMIAGPIQTGLGNHPPEATDDAALGIVQPYLGLAWQAYIRPAASRSHISSDRLGASCLGRCR